MKQNTVKSKILDSADILNLTRIINQNGFFRSTIKDIGPCAHPDCFKYGLIISQSKELGPITQKSNAAFWTDTTKDASKLNNLADALEKLALK